MRWILILFLVGCLSMVLKAENTNCPEQGIPVLATEEKVDSFLAIYPNCRYVLSSFYAVDNVQIFWIKNDPSKYLLFLGLTLTTILVLLKFLFSRVTYFNK